MRAAETTVAVLRSLDEAATTLRARAAAIERIVRSQYLDDDRDAADIAMAQLEIDPARSDEAIAKTVAAIIENP